MVVVVGGGGCGGCSSEDEGGSASSGAFARHHRTMTQRHTINRQLALSTLTAMHRRFSIPNIINVSGRPLAEFRASANKSLDILRQNIQAAVTKDIDQVIKKYLEKFFVPAVNNIRTNLGEESVSEEQLRAVCRAMLDGARTLYAAPPRLSVQSRPAPSPSELSDSESSNGADSRFGRPSSSPSYGKRKESDTDSDVGVGARRKRRIESTASYAHKWDPARLNQDTLFIMGSIANKVLGLGQSRGRLYSKHAGLLRYPADAADKEWIANQNLKTSPGGRTYIMVLEDIEELIVSGDYRHSSSLRLNELSCFRAPPFMLRKIQAYISRRGEMSEEYLSSTPTPTPPPVETVQQVSDQIQIKEENIDQATFDSNVQVKIEHVDENNENIKKQKEALHVDSTRHNKTHLHAQFDPQNTSKAGENFATLVTSTIPSVENNFWKTINNSQLLGDSAKDTFDSNIKVEINPATDLMDADIDFLSSDFCSYAESEADVKKSFDKISDGNDNIFIKTENSGHNEIYIKAENPVVEINRAQPVNITSTLPEALIPKSPVVTSIVGNIAFGSLPPNVQDFIVTTNNSGFAVSNSTSLQTTSPFSVAQTSVYSQTLPSFSQISAPVHGHVISTPATHTSIQVTWQPNLVQTNTRAVYSLANSTKTLNTSITPGHAIVGISNKTTGSILTTGGSFINITPKSFSTGNILHNAIVSRNMVNRSLNANKIELSRTIQSNMNTIVTKSSIVLPNVATFSRAPLVPLQSKIEDDMSITTTKAMIDNTCNSSAMLKQVLTLGSAGVNKTFLSPPVQKMNVVRPSTSASSTLSASHATLSALLSGVDPSSADKKNTFTVKGEIK